MTINEAHLSRTNGLSRRRLLVAGATLPALALGASRPAFAATVQTAGVAPAALVGFDNVLKTYIVERGISCAQLAITKNGKLVLARAYRYSDDPSVPKFTPTSLFRIASLSKHITAVAIMRLAQDGKLSLGTSVATLLGLSTTADARLANVTVWRLLQHTGGWDRDISGDYLYNMDHTISRSLGVSLPITRDHIIQYACGRPLDFAPGSMYAYSNYGYMLLGMIVEKASGMAYESYVQQKILAPVGITRLRLGRTLKAQAAPGEVVYESAQTSKTVTDASGTIVPAPYGGFSMENRGPGGGWLASAVDLVRFARILDAPGTVLNATSIGRMVAKPEIGVTESGSWYGAGLWVRQVTGHLNTWHSGGLPGTYTYTARLQNGFTYAALFNRNQESGSLDFDVLSPRLADLGLGVGPLHELAHRRSSFSFSARYEHVTMS
ncbi:beta-lactamase family protein [Nonomuraea sp. K274]|uniref:Beta-lactamase family protein n=1 Tax=Nonomuraea cypriaca TaxID=1187855 RepID=A0A931A7A5_9ACTN|nr:serine hydrolase domain-containing protein [Nonomuraea cypriaca]MBF8187576.1 beta-lactamase family protein [Nonomuraea cypriaca]